MINSQSESSNPFNLHPLASPRYFPCNFPRKFSHQTCPNGTNKHPWNALLNSSAVIDQGCKFDKSCSRYIMKNDHDSWIYKIGSCMCSITRFVRYFSFIHAEHKVARVEVLKDDQWRPHPWIRNTRAWRQLLRAIWVVAPEIQASPIYEKGRQRELLYWRAPTPNRQILFCFSTNRLFTIVRERESIFVDGDGFIHFSFFNFLSIGWIRKEKGELFLWCIL